MSESERAGAALRKVIIVGSGAVGKTTLATRLITGEFIETQMTVGLSVETWTVEDASDGTAIKIVSFDLGGQNQFRFFQTEFVKGAQFAIIVMDVTRYESFIDLEEWLRFVEQVPEHCRVLVGNKIDLPRVVSDDDIRNFAEEHNLKFVYVSTVTGEGIKELERVIWESLKDDGQCSG